MSYERIRHVHKLSYGRSGDGGVLTRLMQKVDEIDVFLDIVICISLRKALLAPPRGCQ